jgi:hypothetical protein
VAQVDAAFGHLVDSDDYLRGALDDYDAAASNG